MSWSTFKNIMKVYMDNPSGVKSKEDFAKQFTLAYDTAIKMGSVTTRGFAGFPLPVSKGNTEVMEKLMIAACAIAFTKGESGKHIWLKDIGNAVKGYWGGVQLASVPPLIPPILSFQNISLISGLVINPGKWPETGPEQPTDAAENFIDLFITYAQAHLSTIQFTCNTLSLYFGFPLIPPLPGVVNLTGYTLTPAPPSTPSVSAETPESYRQKLKEKVEEATTLSPEQEELANELTDKGYGLGESTGIALEVAPPPRPKVTTVNELTPLPLIEEKPFEKVNFAPKKRPIDELTPPATNNSEKIKDCGNVNLKEPPQLVIDAMRKYGITTPLQKAHFLAQVAHESGNFRYLEEIADGSRYEGRKDLGNIYPGDGPRYKGRGYIQLTGRANYKQFNKGIDDDVVQNPLIVKSKYPGETAGWYWATRKLNRYAIDDTEDSLKQITKRVNGGYNGYNDRKRYFCAYWKKLQENPNLYS